MFVIGLVYAGRLGAFDTSAQPLQTVNLNTLTDSKEREPALERVFTNISDRQFAAHTLFDFVRATRDAGDTLPNVGAILKPKTNADLPLLTASDLTILKPSILVRPRETFAAPPFVSSRQ